MSAVASIQPRAGRDASAPISVGTLVNVELRKMVDTRAGRWLLIGVAAITVIVLGVAIGTGDADTRSFTNLIAVAQLPLSILLPVLGVLAATSEWSQRTVLMTFSLVPSRSRVISAKILAAMVLAIGAVVFATVAAAVAAVIAPIAGDTTSDWSVSASYVGQIVVYQELSMLLGVALGTLLLNSSLAIVLYFVLPTLWGALVSSIGGLDDVQKWLDTGTSWMNLVDPDFTMTGTSWAQALATAGFWIVLPLAAGLYRVLHKEVD
jgi:ABC-type transport system involved in multi-copper enzyme maturation permease subunit